MQRKDPAALNRLINVEKSYPFRQPGEFRSAHGARLRNNQVGFRQFTQHSPDNHGVRIHTLRHLLRFQRLFISPRHKRENVNSYRESAAGGHKWKIP